MVWGVWQWYHPFYTDHMEGLTAPNFCTVLQNRFVHEYSMVSSIALSTPCLVTSMASPLCRNTHLYCSEVTRALLRCDPDCKALVPYLVCAVCYWRYRYFVIYIPWCALVLMIYLWDACRALRVWINTDTTSLNHVFCRNLYPWRRLSLSHFLGHQVTRCLWSSCRQDTVLDQPCTYSVPTLLYVDTCVCVQSVCMAVWE